MKIIVVTTSPESFDDEIQRVKKEAEALGHQLEVLDLEDFSFNISKGKINCDWIEGEIADVYILRGIMHSQKQISQLIGHLRSRGAKVFDNNFLEHKYSIDKATDLIKLTLGGILVPDSYYSRSFDDYAKIAEKLGYPVIVKSAKSGKGEKVYKLDNPKELRQLIKTIEDSGKEAKLFIAQQYIPYIYDLRCLVIGENTYTMRRVPQQGEFRANFSLGGSVELFDLDQKGKDLAIRALNAVGMSIGGVDILITEDNKRYILEVNHTAGFVGMERATGVNIAKVYLEHAIVKAK
jgi:RimK family alpha-L-glutamate ligase